VISGADRIKLLQQPLRISKIQQVSKSFGRRKTALLAAAMGWQILPQDQYHSCKTLENSMRKVELGEAPSILRAQKLDYSPG
jgi:hypothetical protein